jgi:pimeloyl-ACP methyl ester carboxylesterase
MPRPSSSPDSRTARHRSSARGHGPAWGGLLTLAISLLGCTGGPSAGRDLERFRFSAHATSGHTLDIAARRSGDAAAPRIIYVHGTPGDAGAFNRPLLDPVPGFESIAIDRPGFGESRPARAWPSFADQAAAIVPLLVRRDGRWPILVGHSLGGPIIARVAATHPDRVGALVIISGSLDPALEEPRWFNHLADTVLVRALLSRSFRHSNDELMAAPAETIELDALLDRVRCPVVIVHGDRDGLVPVDNVQYMRRRFTEVPVSVTLIRGAGHFIPWTHPAAIRAAILEADALRAGWAGGPGRRPPG